MNEASIRWKEKIVTKKWFGDVNRGHVFNLQKNG